MSNVERWQTVLSGSLRVSHTDDAAIGRMLFFSFLFHAILSSLFFKFGSFTEPVPPLLYHYQVTLVSPRALPRSTVAIQPLTPPSPEIITPKETPLVETPATEAIHIPRPKLLYKTEGVKTLPSNDPPLLPPAPPIPTETHEAISPALTMDLSALERIKNPLYLKNVENKISGKWFPPPRSHSNETIHAIVKFLVHQNGSIGLVEIETSSGDRFFDQAAMRAIYTASPFPPLPPSYQDSPLYFHFNFTLRTGLQ